MVGYDPLGAYFNAKGNRHAFVARVSELPGLDFDLTPNAHTEAYGTAIDTNAFGLRDVEHTIEKAEKYRILALGDSVTFGVGVSAEHTFPRLLGNRMQQDGRPVEVLNAGIPGYNLIDESILLRYVGVKFSPDLIVLGICVNDAGIYTGELGSVRLKTTLERFPFNYSRLLQLAALQWVGSTTIRLGSSPDIAKSEHALAKRYQLVDYAVDPQVQLLMNQVSAGRNPDPRTGQIDLLSWYGSRVHLAALRTGLVAIQELQQEFGFRVVAVVFPALTEQDSDRWTAVYRIIEHEVRRVGFDLVDLAKAFREVGLMRLKVEAPDDLHINGTGHGIVADVIYDFLVRESPYLPDRIPSTTRMRLGDPSLPPEHQ